MHKRPVYEQQHKWNPLPLQESPHCLVQQPCFVSSRCSCTAHSSYALQRSLCCPWFLLFLANRRHLPNTNW